MAAKLNEWYLRAELWTIFFFFFLFFHGVNWACWFLAPKFIAHYRRLTTADQAEWCSRVTSFIHSSLVAIACVSLAWGDEALLWGANPV